jgi:hypothetical protein
MTDHAIPNKNDYVVIVATNIEEDDMSAIIDNLEFEKNIILLTDNASTKSSAKDLYKDILYILDDFSNIPDTIRNLRDFVSDRTVVGVIGLDEEYDYSISKRLAETFTLEFYPKDILAIASNKRLQKKIFVDSGVRIPHYVLFDIHKGISDADLKKVGFPNVLKPAKGFASYNVYINNDLSEFKANVLDAARNIEPFKGENSGGSNESNIFIVEEYVVGNEYSCDFLIDGESHDMNMLRFTRKIRGPAIGEFGGFLLFNPDSQGGSKHAEFRLADLEKVCHKIASAYRFSEGVYNVDFIFSKGEIVVLESTARPGIATFIELMAEVYNYTSINVFIRKKLGLPFHVHIPDKSGAVLYIRTPALGMIESFDITSLEHGKYKDKILSVYKIFDVGSILTEHDYIRSNTNILGYVFFKDISLDELNSLLNYVESTVKISIKTLK